MTKVVFQGREYWMKDKMWLEAAASGLPAFSVEFKDGVPLIQPIDRDQFARRYADRVAGWVKSEPKSISVFREALSVLDRGRFTALYLESILHGLEAVANEFTARTGAQGKVRLPATAKFVVLFHTQAFDGSPQLHAHIAVDPQVQVQKSEKKYATHTRELYSLRRLFSATASHDLGHQLQDVFGVRVQKTDHGIKLPDVPPQLCRLSSVRTAQIDAFLRDHALDDTPLHRRLVAILTRRQNRDSSVGRQAFQDALRTSGFRAEQIFRRMTLLPESEESLKSNRHCERLVGRLARRLTQDGKEVSRLELMTVAMESLAPHVALRRIQWAVRELLDAPQRVGLTRHTNRYGQPAIESPGAAKRLQRLADRVERVLVDEKPRGGREGAEVR